MPTKTTPKVAVVSETPVVVEELNDKERNPLMEVSRKVVLAAIGAVALAQEEVEELVDRLIERGEIAEKDGRKLMHDVMDRRKKTTIEAEDKLGKQVEEILDRLNVPTKADIEILSEKITSLSRKIDELRKEKTVS